MSATSTILFTGFPGFLGSELLPRVLTRQPDARAVCVVQGKFLELAQARLSELISESPDLGGRVDLVEGDITQDDLGLAGADALRPQVSEIYHLAAIYDLAVRREAGMNVNVGGTQRVLDFAVKCGALRRLHYVSTCYVSGRYAGIFGESDLVKGQSFNNYYEETKHLAEVEVQQRMAQGLPTTIYRPSIAVGNSRTGRTSKLDGPYFVIRWIMRQPRLAMMPVVGDPSTVRVNLVPSDFVVDALTHLSGLEESAGMVYQLADPEPLTVDELLTELGRLLKKRIVRVPVLRGPTKLALDYLPGVHRLFQIPATAVDYFVHPTHYTVTNTLDHLAGSGIQLPPLRDYLPRLLDYVERHPELGSAAMA